MRKMLVFVLLIGIMGGAVSCKSGSKSRTRAMTPRERRAVERAIALRQQAGLDASKIATITRRESDAERQESKSNRDKIIARANTREAANQAKEDKFKADAIAKAAAEKRAYDAEMAEKLAKANLNNPKLNPIAIPKINKPKPEIKKPIVRKPAKPEGRLKEPVRDRKKGGFDTPNEVIEGGSAVGDIEDLLGRQADVVDRNGVRELRYDFFERFDAAVYTEGEKGIDIDRVEENYWESMTNPWTMRSKPFIAEWLNGNRSFIEGFKEATRRKTLVGKGALRVEGLDGLRVMGELGLVSRVLAADAYFYIGRGNWRRAQASIDAHKRLGRLLMKERDYAVSERGESFLKHAIEIEISMKTYRERNE